MAIDNNISARRRVFSGLWEAVWRYRQRTLVALGLMVLAKVSAVFVPLVLKAIVDQFSRPNELTGALGGSAGPMPEGTPTVLVLPVFLLLGYALLRFSGTLFNELRDMVFARVTRRTVIGFAERTFAHLMSLSPRFHVQRNTGTLIRDVERGTGGIGFLLGAGLFTIVPTLVEFGAVLVVMISGYSLWFTLVIMTTFFVYGAFTFFLTNKRELRQRKVNELDSTANGRMVDSLLNYETVKVYAREDFERQRYGGVLTQWMEGSVQNQKALSVLHIGQSAIIAVGVAVVMLLAAQQTMQGTMTVGDLVLVNSYIIQICLPLNALGFVFREARDAMVNTEKLFALLEQKADIQDQPDSTPLQVKKGEVVFEQVDFSYEAGRQILQQVGFEIPAGKTVAVVGGSGSGKSTLARLLLRLYDVGAGRVLIDGQDLRSVKLATLREAIGVVPQDTVLFNDTIAYNIGYGRTAAGMSDVIEAAKAAQVHEFILSLPQGYDTVVGERGLKLSGGEKQRIAIARAFLKNPPIMIFDEATSALDTRAERAIQSELDRIAQGRTTLIIAHRLSTIVNADQIIVMDKGRIVERGRHEELLERDGLYAQLWNLQRQQAQVERLERRLARQPVNLAVLMANAIDGLREAIEARGVKLYTDVDLDNARVTGDPSTLAQALRELIMQAVQATPIHGRIELKLERREANARLCITDGRHDLPSPVTPTAAPPSRKASQRRLKLVPAVPAPEPPATQPHGTDTPLDPLELRSTIERQGGEFHIEPPGSLHGMRYVIEMPLRAVGVDNRPTPTPSPEVDLDIAALGDQPLAGLRVMSIDDRADAREALEGLLDAEGAEVKAFPTGTQAIAWLEQHPSDQWPEVIICDIALGDEDGHQVVRRIRQIEQQRGVALDDRVPAIALTGLALPGDRMRALMAGFQVHLAKPVDPQELVSTLITLSGRPGGSTPSAEAA
ncbi:ABC transporter transmembrane domain-containing protein [Ideonella sp. BN130291]|uniref:ABC transporter transmembrane domain-containing protein n=1 Tax=Ideonella sp. BN130291 TaxID=3112940 RepID=UPI002E25A785|nr:ABC transporter transmembrane domain-containing protein [Ideonella sp. BN130291]